MRQLLCTLIMISLLAPAITKAQDTGEPLQLSLEEAMDLAVKNNLQTKNARLDVQKQKAQNAEISGLALPNISAKGEFNSYINPIQSFVPAEFIGGAPGTFVAVPFTPKYGNTASVSGSQILFDGSVLVALQARKAVLKLFEQSEALTEQEVRYNVQKAYLAIVVAQRQLQTLDESMVLLRDMSNDVTVLYENGFAEKIAVDQTKVQLNNLISDSIKSHSLLDVSMHMLKYQLGLADEQNLSLTDTSIEEQLKDAQMLLLEDVQFTKRKEYSLLQTQLKLNEFDIKRYRMAALPSLAAFGSAAYTYSTNAFGDIFNKQYIFYSLVGLQLNVPIFDGMQRRNKVKQAKITMMQTQNSIKDLELGIKLQKNASSTQLKNALMTIANQKANLELAKSVLDLAHKKYKAGVGNNTEVSQAQTEMLAAQSNYFQALLDAANAKADLKKALGEF